MDWFSDFAVQLSAFEIDFLKFPDISKDTIDDIFDKWYEDTHFNHQEIPGYFTNNSQIVQGLQENLNEGILDSIENFIHIQNNLLKLLSEDELMAFAK